MSKLKVLSLGAGVQSSTLLLMACKDEIEKPDVAIFADTGWESGATYKHLDWLKIEAGKYGIPVIIVQEYNIKYDCLNGSELHHGMYLMPIFMRLNGKLSIGKRQCTSNYKIRPLYHKVRELLGVSRRARLPKDALELWIGISLDESQRIYNATAGWVFNRFPLAERFMTRNDCELWLHNNYHITVPKSSCVGCPYHDKRCWQDIYSVPDEWADAVLVDEAIRHGHPRYEQFLHNSGRPLAEIDLRTPEDRGQIPFDFYKQERITLFAKSNPLWLPSNH